MLKQFFDEFSILTYLAATGIWFIVFLIIILFLFYLTYYKFKNVYRKFL